MMGKMMFPQDMGAFTTVFAACAPRDNPEISHGAYIFPPNIAKKQESGALDDHRQEQLFQFTTSFLKSIDVQVPL